MSGDVGLSQRTLRLRTAFHLALTLAVLLMLGMLVAVAIQNRANGDAIRDCTTPGGECFERSAKRQAQVIGQPPAPINDVVILAAACADRPGVDTEAEIRACVIDGLTR